MKRKHAQRKRNAKASPPSRPPAKISVVPPPSAADEQQLTAQLDAMLPREALDSGEIDIGPLPRVFSQVDMHTESNFFSGYSGDLSDGGVFVVTYAPLKLGQPVEVELSLPGGLFISASGRVAFLRAPSQHNAELAPGAGIVFEDIDAAARRAAESFMLRREPTFVDPH